MYQVVYVVVALACILTSAAHLAALLLQPSAAEDDIHKGSSPITVLWLLLAVALPAVWLSEAFTSGSTWFCVFLALCAVSYMSIKYAVLVIYSRAHKRVATLNHDLTE